MSRKDVWRDITNIVFFLPPTVLSWILFQILAGKLLKQWDWGLQVFLIATFVLVIIWLLSRLLNRLPWYLVIGPPGSGKTTLLRNSALKEVLPKWRTSQKFGQFLADKTIILDKAGRYITHSYEESGRGEWLEFLKRLKKFLKGKTLSGVIVTLDIDEKLTESELDYPQKTKIIRENINDLIERFGINLPIYLVFTKSDHIHGFSQFFEDLTASERAQGWGCTLTGHQQNDPGGIFEAECKTLYRALNDRGLMRLASEKTDSKQEKEEIHRFPLEFNELVQKLRDFVEALFQATVFHEKLIFRGFYFTSGAQPESSNEQKSYFIKDLLSKIIRGDQDLAQLTEKGGRQVWLKRLALSAYAFVFGIVILLITKYSYLF